MKAAHQNQINLGKDNGIRLQEMVWQPHFILFLGLFVIIAQSAYGSAIILFMLYIKKSFKIEIAYYSNH